VKLRDRLETLDERERRLLGILVVVFAGLVVALVFLGTPALLASQRSDNQALREAIEAIQQDRAAVQKADAERRAVLERYASPAPPLAGFLASLAQQSAVEIPESQDLDTVPHGTRYEERSTKIALRRVGMLALVKFMERIEQAAHPVRISRLNIRKRGSELDSYDVEMIVSAYDRKAPEPKPAEAGAAEQPAGEEG
jgi:general secretion pathway protein M